jgi:ankyrin repeat protein
MAYAVLSPSSATTIQAILQCKGIDVNLVESQNGNTPLHRASMTGRLDVVHDLLSVSNIDDTILNFDHMTAMDLAKTPDIAQLFQGVYTSFIRS